MKFLMRKRFTFGPFYVTVNQAGKLSYGIKVGPVSHNFTRKTTSINTPGPGYVRHQHGKKTQR